MQTPAPRPTRPGPNGTEDATVLLNTQVIGQAAPRRPPTRPNHPAYPPRPYPAIPGAATAPAAPPPTEGNPETDADTEDESPKLSLTATQVVASMSAAVVAAFLGAQLGVAGTVIGAAIASVVSVVGSAVIGHSLLITRRKVVQTVQHVRTPGSPADDQQTVLLTAVTRTDLERTARLRPPTGVPTPQPGSGPVGAPVTDRRGRWSRPGRLRWVLVGLATSVLVFAGALGAVTVVEAVTGAPISGGSQGGFSVLGGNSRGDGDSDNAPTTTSPSTATVTETTTAPATTAESTAPGSSSSTEESSPSATSESTAPSSPATTAQPPAPAAGDTEPSGVATTG